MIHRIQLEQFEGPIELLLYLVREDELSIEEIPIARITDQYLAFLQSRTRPNIENAAEFLLMAVVLIRMKMRAMLPRPQPEDLEAGTMVSMDEIVAEFQRYRQAAQILSQIEDGRRNVFPRAGVAPKSYQDSGDIMVLTEAFQALLAKLEPKDDWVVEPVQLHIEDAIRKLRTVFIERHVLDFIGYLSALEKLSEMIITFIAALELVRLGEIRVSQDDETGRINLFRRTPNPVLANASNQA